MQYFNSYVGIETIPPLLTSGDPVSLDETTRKIRARQLGHFMGRVQRFYMQRLGLARIDTDPFPDPEDPKDQQWRMEVLQQAGHVQRQGLQYIGAFALADGLISSNDAALKGLLVLCKPRDEATKQRIYCSLDKHAPTEVLEWNVMDYDGPGLGRALLQEGVAYIHSADEVIADVAMPNLRALEMYDHYGFTRDDSIQPMEHGVFATRHVRLHTTGAALKQDLHLP